MKKFIISKDTVVHGNYRNTVQKNAIEILNRDIKKVIQGRGTRNVIEFSIIENRFSDDEFLIVIKNSEKLTINASSDLGLMYGALEISKKCLGIDPFWFWNDHSVETKQNYIVTQNDNLAPEKFTSKYRGWFVNDEVLLEAWTYRHSREYVWKMVFETLLRLGGNTIIPGTGETSIKNRGLASNMGLSITHHHAEPLGAEMFSRKYPNLEADYLKHPELFELIWLESIKKQADFSVVWNLGFRGQGDEAFWMNYDYELSDIEKANIINEVINKQYNLVKDEDSSATCSVNIYGELPYFYYKNLLKIPEDVIEIWADNGYGKMVSRRQGDEDNRIPVISAQSNEKKQGIYYHITFHDLQASNFLTLFQETPSLVQKELLQVRNANMDNVMLCNVGNIKPHLFYVQYVADIWRRQYTSISENEIIHKYVKSRYKGEVNKIARLYKQYFKSAPHYSRKEDQKCGDEFYAYLSRKLIQETLKNSDSLSGYVWLVEDESIKNLLNKVSSIISENKKQYWELYNSCKKTFTLLTNSEDETFLYNDLFLSISTNYNLLHCLSLILESIPLFKEHKLLQCFLTIDKAIKHIDCIVKDRENNPSDRWRDFYNNDCYTNVISLRSMLKTLRSVIRITGDSSDLDMWEKEYIMLKNESKVNLLSNTKNALSDDELARELNSVMSDYKFI